MIIEANIQRLAEEQIQKYGSVDVPGLIWALSSLFPRMPRDKIEELVFRFHASLGGKIGRGNPYEERRLASF